MAFGALAANRGRSMLTVLSITIGAFAIVVMSSLAESGLTTLQRGLEELGGARLMLGSPRKPGRAEAKQGSYRRGFARVDRDRVFDGVPHLEDAAMYAGLGTKDVT